MTRQDEFQRIYMKRLGYSRREIERTVRSEQELMQIQQAMQLEEQEQLEEQKPREVA